MGSNFILFFLRFFWIIIQLKIWDWDIEGEESRIIWLGDTETQEAREIGEIVNCFAGVGWTGYIILHV